MFVMRLFIAVISILFCFLLLGATASAYLLKYEPPVDPPITIDNRKLWSNVQTWRSNQELIQYRENELLCKYASIRVEQVKSDWSHDSFIDSVVKPLSVDDSSFEQIGENLARDYQNEGEIISGWLVSPSHLENLEAPFTDSCIKCVDNNCVQLFAR